MIRATFTFIIVVTSAATALAQNTDAFDGIYAGVSITTEKFGSTEKYCALFGSRPGTLTVSNGLASTPTAQGTVSPGGALVLNDPHGTARRGQVDTQGNAMVKYTGINCVYTYMWRKTGR